jgi:serine/threonine-protein kinase
MVFHRDIKPANLIRRADGRIALVDFGAARDLGSTVGATLVGTFGYMPVEQMGGIVDASTDLYALGATLCHLLSRRPPWKLVEDPQALERLNVSRGFRDYLARLTARQPADRYLSAAAAAQGLRSPPRRKRPAVRGWGVRGVVVIGLVFMATMGAATLVVTGLEPERHPTVRTPDRTVSVYYDRDVRIERHDSPEASAPIPPKGSLLLDVCADPSGEVTDIRVLGGNLDEYGSLIIDEARKLRYPPHVVDGKPVPHCRPVRYVVRKR